VLSIREDAGGGKNPISVENNGSGRDSGTLAVYIQVKFVAVMQK
jgi:hypothetical protein